MRVRNLRDAPPRATLATLALPAYGRSSLVRGGLSAGNPLVERELPALLVFWAYQQDELFFGRRQFFSRVSAKKNFGVFVSYFLGVFVLFGGVFVLFGCFLFFARQRESFLGSLLFLGGVYFRRPTTPKRGVPALQKRTTSCTALALRTRGMNATASNDRQGDYGS